MKISDLAQSIKEMGPEVAPHMASANRLWTELPSTKEWQLWDNNLEPAQHRATIKKHEIYENDWWWVELHIAPGINYGPDLYYDLDNAKKSAEDFYTENEGYFKS